MKNGESDSKLHQMVTWCKNQPILAIIIFLVIVIIGIGSFTNALDSIISFGEKHFSNKSAVPTAGSETEKNTPLRTDKSNEQEPHYQHLSPLAFHIIPGVTSEQRTKIIEKIRAANNLRRLTPLESGKELSQAPPGTFFYMFALFLQKGDYLPPEQGKISAYEGVPGSYFEVHYVDRNEILLLAFVTSETAALIPNLDGNTEKDAIFSPTPWGQFDSLTFVPLSRIVNSKAQTIEIEEGQSMYILDVRIR